MSETVLVTGGTGFVAGWCIVELLERGYHVRATIRDLKKEPAVRDAVAAVTDPADRLTFWPADLTSDDGWAAAMAGCDYVLHVASPLGIDRVRDPDELIVPARDGTLRVLRAATGAGVERVVMTSACAAASPPSYSRDGVTDETLWTDAGNRKLDAYRKSKTLAERAAWDFIRDHPGSTTLTTILPGAVFGPVLSGGNPGSVQVIGRMLSGGMPATPRLGFEVVDVRDLADAHVRAMTAPEAAGQRFIAVGDFVWMSEVSAVLRAQLGSSAAKVPTRRLPDPLFRLAAIFDPALRAVLPALGRKHRHSAAKARRLLNWHPRPAASTIVDCGRSLVAHGLV
jgi:nucleoside-diphosphate-sugar epimerase